MLTVGGISEKRGSLTRGLIPLLALPTGGDERLAVVIASGKAEGPTLLLTANIHGGEIIGIQVIHRLLERLDLSALRGRIVCFPSLNPSGLRAGTRHPTFEAVDPNRKWPETNPSAGESLDATDPYFPLSKAAASGPQEKLWERVFALFREARPDLAVDLHSFSVNSMPFTIFDRVFHTGDEVSAKALVQRQDEMASAMGFTPVLDLPAKDHVHLSYHRTTSAAITNHLRIPSCTLELGPTGEALPANREAAVEGLFNLLKWAGMLDGEPQKLRGVPVVPIERPHRFLVFPKAPGAGILDQTRAAGEPFRRGDELGVIRAITGERLHVLRAEMDGFLIGWYAGITVYEHQNLAWVGVPDEGPRAVSWDTLNKKH